MASRPPSSSKFRPKNAWAASFSQGRAGVKRVADSCLGVRTRHDSAVTALRTAALVGLLAAGCASETDVHLLEPAARPVVLQHRYDFDGRGAVLADLVGD